MFYAEDERARSLAVLDVMLSQGAPFGDSGYVHGQMQSAFRRRLGRIAASVPGAGALADALDTADAYDRYRVYGDPVVRCAVQHAMRQIVTGAPYGLPLPECAQVFGETLRALQAGTRGGPLESGAPAGSEAPALDRLGPDKHHGAIWSDDGSDNVFRRTFRYLIQENFGDPVGSPNQAGLDALRRGAQLLEEILPAVSASALSHAHVVALCPSTGRWASIASASQYRVAGTVFLQRSCTSDPWWTAEHLLHEALHHKLYDIRSAHTLFAEDSRPEESAEESDRRIVSIWNMPKESNPNLWGVSRSMAAFHVYAHLALFSLQAEQRAAELETAYGPRSAPRSALIDSRTAFERARYLGSAIRQSLLPELGAAGQCLIEWLTGFLDELGPAPAPRLLHADLKLQRYRRESAAAGPAAEKSSTAAQLNAMITGELAAARQILAELDAGPELAQLDDQTSGTGEKPGPGDFPAARDHIADALSQAISNHAAAGPPSPRLTTAGELIEAMIDHSSQRLQDLTTKPPPPTQPPRDAGIGMNVSGSGDESAELLRLTDALAAGYGKDEFCLFLHSIVRMHAPETIVELGTGCGVSAFWMAMGAKKNGSGHVWTVDRNESNSALCGELGKIAPELRGTLWDGLSAAGPGRVLAEVSRRLRLDEHLTFITKRMHPEIQGHFDDYPFTKPVDLLFADFDHKPTTILRILAAFLPQMSRSSSIFIDSAPTSWPAYLLLEQLVEHLNNGRIPALLQEQSAVDLTPVIRNQRIKLVHLTEWRRRDQNSVAWLKLEPIDVQPHPRTAMRRLF